MPQVLKANYEDKEAVVAFLTKHQPSVGKPPWDALFDLSWNPEENYFGYVLKEQNEILGFLGLIFSKQTIGGNQVKVCNMTSWVVREDYRNQSLSMLMPVLKLKDYLLTNLSPNKAVYEILSRMGFKILEEDLCYFPPLPSLSKKPSILLEERQIKNHLSAEEKQLYEYHKSFPVFQFLILNNDQSCYIIANKTIKRGLPFASLHYASSPELFHSSIKNWNFSFSRKNKSLGWLIDSRFVPKPFQKYSIKLPFPRLLREPEGLEISPEEVSSLFSELVLLGI